MGKTNITDVATKIVGLLTPLKSDERQRVVQAALTLLGEAQGAAHVQAEVEDKGAKGDAIELPQRAKTWMRQNGLTFGQIQQVFHVEDGTVEVIASAVPGKSDKDKTLNAYIMKGIVELLASGTTSFDDKSARALSNSFGCYNQANHAVYMKDKGNWLIGSKDKGWTLTAPGLAQGAAIVKEMTKEAK
jgi:hypothetical protein